MSWVSDVMKVLVVVFIIGFVGFYAWQFVVMELDKFKVDREKRLKKLEGKK